MSKHTALPWRVETIVLDKWTTSKEEETDNKRFAELACNSHYELLEALKHAHTSLRTFRNVPKNEQEWVSTDDATMELIEQAIAKAEA